MNTKVLCLSAMLLSPCFALRAQEIALEPTKPTCFSFGADATTDRPVAGSSTTTTPCGVVEIQTGIERQTGTRGAHRDATVQTIAFGLTPRMDAQYSSTRLLQMTDRPEIPGQASDAFLGLRYRFTENTRRLPSFGALYTIKIPRGNPGAGMGSGRFDHSLSLLASKDLGKLHFDFNATPNFVGRADAPGFDRNASLALFASVALPWKPVHTVTFAAGSFGCTHLAADAPGTASGSIGLTWHAAHAIIFDAAVDAGVMPGAPRKRFAIGVTYAPTNLYAILHRPKVH